MENSVYTNKKFKEAVLEISKDCDSVEIYFDLQKYAGFLPTDFNGEYKGYYFTIHGREYGKWFEMIEPYDCDLKEFIEIIGDNEIDKLDDKLDLHYHRTTDFSLGGGEIEWENDEVPDDIKDAFTASYGDDGEGILNDCDWDPDSLELHEPYNNITSIQVKIKKGEKEHKIKWLNKNYYNEG